MGAEKKMGYRVEEDIVRPPKELIEKLRAFSSCELCDGSIVYNAMDYHIKPMVTEKKIVGPAVTLHCTLGDSLLITKAISMCQPGDVLVVDGHGSGNNALWGDHRSMISKALGLEGVVLDGAFRDIEETEEIGFPIYARNITAGSSTKNSNGEINVPISCGGVPVRPGDIIVGDRNGVCVVPPECAEEIMRNASAKIEKLNKLKDEIKNEGKIIPENFGDELRKLGY